MNITQQETSPPRNKIEKNKGVLNENKLISSQTLQQLKEYNHFHGVDIKRNNSMQPKKKRTRDSGELISPQRSRKCSHSKSHIEWSPGTLMPNRHRICCSHSKKRKKLEKKDFTKNALQKHRAARTIAKVAKRWKKAKLREYFRVLRDFGLFCTISEDSAHEAVMSRSEYKEMFDERVEEKVDNKSEEFQEHDERRKLFEVKYLEEEKNFGIFVQEGESGIIRETDFSGEALESYVEDEEEEVNLLEDSVTIEEIEDFDNRLEESQEFDEFQDERKIELLKLKNEMISRGMGKLRLFFLDVEYDIKMESYYLFFEKLKILNFLNKVSSNGKNLNIVDYSVKETFLDMITRAFNQEKSFKKILTKISNSEKNPFNTLKSLLLPLTLKSLFKKIQRRTFKKLSKSNLINVRRVNTSPHPHNNSKNLSSMIGSNNNTRTIMMFSKKSVGLRDNCRKSYSYHDGESAEYRECVKYIKQHRDKTKKNALVFLIMKLEKSQNLKLYKVLSRLKNFNIAKKKQVFLKRVRRGVFFLTIIEKIKNLQIGFNKLKKWDNFVKKSGGYFGKTINYSSETILLQDRYLLRDTDIHIKGTGVKMSSPIDRKKKKKKKKKTKKISKNVQTEKHDDVLIGKKFNSRHAIFTSKLDKKSHKNLIKIFSNKRIRNEFSGSPIYKTEIREGSNIKNFTSKTFYNPRSFNAESELEDYQQRKKSMIEELKKNSEEYYTRNFKTSFGEKKCICGNFNQNKNDFEISQEKYQNYVKEDFQGFNPKDNLLCIFCLHKKLKNKKTSSNLKHQSYLGASSPASYIGTEIINFGKETHKIEPSFNPEFLESYVNESNSSDEDFSEKPQFQYHSNPVNFESKNEIFTSRKLKSSLKNNEKFIRVDRENLNKFYIKDTVSIREALDRRKSNSRKRRQRARSYAEYMEDGKSRSTSRKRIKKYCSDFEETVQNQNKVSFYDRKFSCNLTNSNVPETLKPELSYQRKERRSRDRLLNKNLEKCYSTKCNSCIFNENYYKQKIENMPHTVQEKLKTELCLKCGNKNIIYRDIKLISEPTSSEKKPLLRNFQRRKSFQMKKKNPKISVKRSIFRQRNSSSKKPTERIMGLNVHKQFQEFENKLSGLIKNYNLGAEDYQFRKFKFA